MSPLMYACRYGHFDIVKKLLQYKIVQDHIHDCTNTNYTFRVGHVWFCNSKINFILKINAISMAALFGYKQILEYILNHPQLNLNLALKNNQMVIISVY